MDKSRPSIFKIIQKDKAAQFACAFLLCISIISLLAPLLSANPSTIDVNHMLEGISKQHWFGTDELGRDFFTRTAYGGRVSLLVGIVTMLVSTFIGSFIGLTSGYVGGLFDAVLMRVIDVLTAIPWMIWVTIISLFLKPGIGSIIIVISAFSWMELARLVRAETLSLKQREYVIYAFSNGDNTLDIIKKHILPGVLPTLITAATTNIAMAILTESTLSFLGLGIQQPVSSWGNLLQSAQANLSTAPHMAIVPGLLIVSTVYSFNKLGDVLQTYFEQRPSEL